MLVKHLRDDLRKPFGTMVAINPDRISVTICCPKDIFNKKRGIEIAQGRAERGHTAFTQPLPNRFVKVGGELTPIHLVVSQELGRMKERAEKYYGTVAQS